MVPSRDIWKLLDIPGVSRYPWFHQAFAMKLLTNIAFTHCSRVHCFKCFLSKHPLLQNYISGRKEAVHIKYVSDLGLRLKLGAF